MPSGSRLKSALAKNAELVPRALGAHTYNLKILAQMDTNGIIAHPDPTTLLLAEIGYLGSGVYADASTW